MGMTAANIIQQRMVIHTSKCEQFQITEQHSQKHDFG